MKDWLVIACGAGLQDGLNPCIFMTSAIFIVHWFWLARNSSRMWLSVIFALLYVLGVIIFNFSPALILVLNKNFIFIAKIVYLVLGLWSFVLAVLFLKDWYFLIRGLRTEEQVAERIKTFQGNSFVACLITVFVVTVLSALAALWPINNFVMILGNEALFRGQWQRAVPLLLTYIIFSSWPLWFVWAFIIIKNLRPSLLKIVSAAIFFAASSCLILIFK